MTSRHFYTSPDSLVLKSLRGAVLLNPSLRLHPASRTVYTTDRPAGIRVSVISGGGAGHEPAHSGYVGRGMLSACVSGEIFASPSSKQILNTIRLAALGGDATAPGRHDVLIIINNYTGDRLNFGLAMEKARVLFQDVNIASVVVADDVSLLDSPAANAVGPRGLAGNILVCKLLGALAQTGASLDQVKAYGNAVVSNLASIGVALDHCHVPGRPQQRDVMADDECEIGLGLHNEAGVSTQKMEDAESVIREMVRLILNREGSDAFVKEDPDRGRDETVLFVNNLGGVSQLEMTALLSDLVDVLAVHSIYPRRIYLSSFMTSLNAPGFSASLLNVSSVHRALKVDSDINTLELLDAPTDATSWLGVVRYWPKHSSSYAALKDTTDYITHDMTQHAQVDMGLVIVASEIVEGALRSACQAILDVEPHLTEYDTIAGDGDCGHTFAAGARAILAVLEQPAQKLTTLTPAALAEKIADILEDAMGGTIGALFGIYLNAYSQALRSANSAHDFTTAPLKALEALSRHTPAKPGDRTIIDALHPFCHELEKSRNFREAVNKAIAGAESTQGMKPKLGRAAYLGEGEMGGQKRELPPDPGAWGIAKLLEGFANGFYRRNPEKGSTAASMLAST